MLVCLGVHATIGEISDDASLPLAVAGPAFVWRGRAVVTHEKGLVLNCLDWLTTAEDWLRIANGSIADCTLF